MDNRTSGTTPESGATTAAAPAPSQTAPAAPSDAPVATAPVAPPAQDDAGGTAAQPEPEPEAQEGGAGDEEGIRVPVDLLVSSDAVAPPTVTVPAFLPIGLSARSTDGRAHRVTVAGTTVSVPASGTASARLDGLRRGTYEVQVDGRPLGELVAGDEPGP